MRTLKLTDSELEYMRYIFINNAGTEEYNTPEEEKQTLKLIRSLEKKLN